MNNNLGKYPKSSSVCNCMNIRRAARAVSQFYDDTLAPSGLSITQLGMLLEISSMEKPGVSELANTFRIDRTTMNRNLKPLLEAGLVVLETGSDARKKEVCLTELGRQKMTNGTRLWQQAQEALTGYLGESNLIALRETLAKLEAIVP